MPIARLTTKLRSQAGIGVAAITQGDGRMEQKELNSHLAAILNLISDSGGSYAEQSARHEKITKYQRALREEYGRRRGWTQADGSFPLRAIAQENVSSDEWSIEFADHRAYWTLAGYPLAVSAHLYGFDDNRRDAARAWAERLGLTINVPSDFPSWWYPGRTTLVEIIRASVI